MKTIIKASSEPLSWYFLPDSALVNSGKPFFIPEFADEFEAVLAPVVRIGRIGKSIGARFAERYYSEIAPGVHFRAPKLRRSLLEAGVPADASYSFDRSLTVGNFIEAGEFLTSVPIVMEVCDSEGGIREERRVATDLLKNDLGPMLEAVSATNTIKMGDYLLPVVSEPIGINIGDTVVVRKGEVILLTIHIR